MSRHIPGGEGSPGRKQATGGRAGHAPVRGMRWSVSSRHLNQAGYGNAPRRPGRGPGRERGQQ